MSGTIAAVLALIEQLLPSILSASEASVVANVVTILTGLLPYIIQEVEALYTPVKNIIDALSANPATTADQLSALQAIDNQVDKAFEDAAAATDAELANQSSAGNA